jgi:hypothetical protein
MHARCATRPTEFNDVPWLSGPKTSARGPTTSRAYLLNPRVDLPRGNYTTDRRVTEAE